MRCYFCRRSYTPEQKEQGYDKSIRQKAIKMYIDGSGLRRIARQLSLHHQTVANWVQAQSEKLPNAPVPDKIKTAEFDEIFTYIGDKKTEFTLLLL